MVLGSHVIFGAYGFWLPNDPRGSWSTFVGAWELFRYGPATKVSVRHSVAGARHDVSTRLAAKSSLKHSPVKLSGAQARAVAIGFAAYAKRAELTIWACAVLPDHVHLVIARHHLETEKLIVQLKGAATRRLVNEGLHPFGYLAVSGQVPPKCFARGGWKGFLNTADDIRRAIRYVESNPIKEGLPKQRWSFVTPYEP